MAGPWWLPFGKVPEIAPHELHAAVQAAQPLQILDVRTALEFAQGHVRGARSVPVTGLKAELGGLGLDRAIPVVAICLSAHRSIPAVRLLAESGFEARQLQGGMLAWFAAGLPVERAPRGG